MAPESQPDTDRTNSATFVFITSILLIIVLIFPWIFGLSFLCFLLGYYLLDNISENICKLIFQNVEVMKSPTEVFKLDPLLHPDPLFNKSEHTSHRHSHSSNENHIDLKQTGTGTVCPVCDAENCPRSASNENDNRTPSFAHFGKGSHDLRIDRALDKSLAKFCTTIFEFYINSDWAPYETRKQLKLTFKALLTNFGEKLNSNLAADEKALKFCEDKIIPLCFHYLEKIWINYCNQREVLQSSASTQKDKCELEKMALLKLRRLCRQLLKKNLPSQDQKCPLWMELCVAVLGDGVLWNLILLGRNKLPRLLHDYCSNYKAKIKSISSTIEPFSWPLDQTTGNKFSALVYMKIVLQNIMGSHQWFMNYSDKLRIQSSVSEIDLIAAENENYITSHAVEQQTSLSIASGGDNDFLVNKVPLLVDSFLNPANDLYQPDSISSRWRPTLDEILTERDLLYCLIQYLKGHKALEYLQAVLDESPDGNAYCKKVLQLEYLPGFCRSKFFMESLGVSQVDCALEAGNDSPNSRRKMGHTRSSSYGSVNSGMQIWKIADPKAVDGLPLHASSIGTAGSTGAIESDFAFRRRQYSPEGIISKFILSTGDMTDPSKKDDHETKEGNQVPTRRVGIHAKTYQDLATESVLNEVLLSSCDIYDCAIQIAVSGLTRQVWVQPVLSGWSQLLRPFLKPYFDENLKSQLNQYLTISTCVYCVDLITQAFIDNSTTSATDPSETTASSETVPGNEEPLKSEQEDPDHATRQNLENENIAKLESSLSTFCHWLLSQLLDPVEFALALQSNEDEIILFFVDLVDLLVKQVIEGN